MIRDTGKVMKTFWYRIQFPTKKISYKIFVFLTFNAEFEFWIFFLGCKLIKHFYVGVSKLNSGSMIRDTENLIRTFFIEDEIS